MNTIIQIEDMTKRFGKTVAVDRLNLEVPEGSIFAFLGPNGAGKTTTIKTLMNIFPPDEGVARVLGVPSTALSPAQFQRIGYVSENQQLPGWLTVRTTRMPPASHSCSSPEYAKALGVRAPKYSVTRP